MLREFTCKISRKKSIIWVIIYNFIKVLKFELFLQYLSQKLTKTLHLEVVLNIILTSYILFLRENFNTCIVNIRRVYATNKNKVSIIICPPTLLAIKFPSTYVFFQNHTNLKRIIFLKNILF